VSTHSAQTKLTSYNREQGIKRCEGQTQVGIRQMYPFDFLCDTSVETLASNKIELTSFQLHTDLSTYTEALCYKQKRQTVSKFANSKLVKQG